VHLNPIRRAAIRADPVIVPVSTSLRRRVAAEAWDGINNCHDIRSHHRGAMVEKIDW